MIGRIWELRHNFTAYDATYIALAEAINAALYTSDGPGSFGSPDEGRTTRHGLADVFGQRSFKPHCYLRLRPTHVARALVPAASALVPTLV